MSMACRQCEQTFRGTECTTLGVCGKTDVVSGLQDVLIHALEGVAVFAFPARQSGWRDRAVDTGVMNGVFATLTNVNFDPDSLADMIRAAVRIREVARVKVSAPSEPLPAAAQWAPADTVDGLIRQGSAMGLHPATVTDPDERSLREILLFGLKGMAAYAAHAARLGAFHEEVTDFLYEGLAALAAPSTPASRLLDLVMKCGRANLLCLETLDWAHTDRFGHPEPTRVKLGWKKGPAIIVSGHDLDDLAELLEQTQGKGIYVYTHGEMLPGLAYPGLKKYPHLAGHYGTAWQNQQKEFRDLPAAILMTTNCLQEPDVTYRDRIFTTNAVGWPGVRHIADIGGRKDFSPLIETARSLGGFPEDDVEKEITIGFAHRTLLGVADKILAAIKEGRLKRFFLIGGCDGARSGRNYYTKMAEFIPDDCLILTLACGKNRINRLDYKDVAGFPKLLDCGQCNDAYSAIVVAQALAKALGCGINDLPLSLIISWYEQKAVAVLLSLLALGIKNIRLGPSLPAFLSPNVLKILVDKFNIMPIKTVDEDLADIFSRPLTTA